jgi:nucleoid DNA-binding protein
LTIQLHLKTTVRTTVVGRYTRAGITKAQATKALKALLNGIESSIAKGEKVGFSGFGAWEQKPLAARNGRALHVESSWHINHKLLPFKPITYNLSSEKTGFKVCLSSTQLAALHNGRNPGTGEALKIAASTGVKFKAGASFKAAVKASP